MADQTQQSRRKLLKIIAVGGGVFTTAKALPEKWTSPVVDSVVLPVHADMSPTDESPTAFQIESCTGESKNGAPEGFAFQTGAEAIIDISATVSPIPPVGTMIRLITTHDDAGQGSYSDQVEPTNASGVADTFINIGFPNADPFEIGTVITLQFVFDDAATFGESSCEISFTVIATP